MSVIVRAFLRHGVPIGLGAGLLFFWSIGLLFHPMLTTGAFIHQDRLPMNAVCDPWQLDPTAGKEYRRCVDTTAYYTTTIVQYQERQSDGSMRRTCEDFSFEFHRFTAFAVFLAGVVTWCVVYYAWLRLLNWEAKRSELDGTGGPTTNERR